MFAHTRAYSGLAARDLHKDLQGVGCVLTAESGGPDE
jgi:hypothetical protein